MVVLDVVLLQRAVVLAPLLVQKDDGVGLLQERVTHILLVLQYLADGAVVPAWIAPCGTDTVTFQSSGNLLAACTLQILLEDTLDDLRLRWIDNQMSLLVLVVAEEVSCIHQHLPLLEAVLDSHFRILAKLAERLRFLLRQRCHNGDQDFALCVHRVNGLLFKENRNVDLLQQADVFQAVQLVAGKTADRLREDHVDFSRLVVLDHGVELLSAFCRGCADNRRC